MGKIFCLIVSCFLTLFVLTACELKAPKVNMQLAGTLHAASPTQNMWQEDSATVPLKGTEPSVEPHATEPDRDETEPASPRPEILPTEPFAPDQDEPLRPGKPGVLDIEPAEPYENEDKSSQAESSEQKAQAPAENATQSSEPNGNAQSGGKQDPSEAIPNTKPGSNDKTETYDQKNYILKVSNMFYGGKMDKKHITSITFTKNAPENYDEKWYANERNTKHVVGYRVGTEVFIVGEEIVFNPSCAKMFAAKNYADSPIWANLEVINGLDMVNTSLVQNMGYMFYGAEKLKHLDVGGWDVSRVDRMEFMFAECRGLKTLDVSNWDTSSVALFNSMFQGASHSGDRNLEYLDVSNWDTSSALRMNHMFYGCSKLKTIDVSTWNVERVTTFSHMFADCYSLEYIDVSHWNSKSAWSFDAFFNDCHSLTVIDISNLNTAACIQFSQMFEACKSLTTIIGIEDLDVSQANDYAFSEMFHQCHSLTSLNLSKWNTSKADNMARMFAGCRSLSELNLSNFDITHVDTMFEMFKGCPADIHIYGIENWNLEGIDTNDMF